jgi:5-methylcytosine-specific restriction endonuclease McrA
MEEAILDHLATEAGGAFPDFSTEDLEAFEEYLSKDKRHRVRSVMLGLAVHFTPHQALAQKLEDDSIEGPYDRDMEPYMMIEEYLTSNFEAEEATARTVAQELGKLWDNWLDDDRYISYEDAIKKKLRQEQNNRCKNCNVKLEDEEASVSYQQEDELKPIHEFSREQTAIELDHIEPLSHLGNHKLINLQLLCRFCNQGKSNRVHVPIREQIEYAPIDIDEIPKSHRRQVFYAVTKSATACGVCGDKNKELTMKFINNRGCFVVSNLEPICVECKFDI